MSGHDAAISAMDALFAPIIGITLVLISVFLPAAFLPGLTGRMYSQFALVIAATALLSAVNAATLKPTQCALWLRRPVPPEQRNFFYRGFNAVYNRLERGYAGLIGRLVAHSNLSVISALILIGIAGYGLSRVPTGLFPSRIRATCWWPHNCPTARRSTAPSVCSTRSANWPARPRASIR
jgi:HAE1 family hydrophobic/amphiphilic exporter-1